MATSQIERVVFIAIAFVLIGGIGTLIWYLISSSHSSGNQLPAAASLVTPVSLNPNSFGSSSGGNGSNGGSGGSSSVPPSSSPPVLPTFQNVIIYQPYSSQSSSNGYLFSQGNVQFGARIYVNSTQTVVNDTANPYQSGNWNSVYQLIPISTTKNTYFIYDTSNQALLMASYAYTGVSSPFPSLGLPNGQAVESSALSSLPSSASSLPGYIWTIAPVSSSIQSTYSTTSPMYTISPVTLNDSTTPSPSLYLSSGYNPSNFPTTSTDATACFVSSAPDATCAWVIVSYDTS